MALPAGERNIPFTRILILAALLAPPFTTSAQALDASIVRGLRELDATARLEQRCDLEALSRIAADTKDYRPDRVVAGATAETRIEGDTLDGTGGAFRSKGKWYSLTYVCRTSADHMDVLEFSYEIGAAIPEDKWESYGLWE